MIASRRAGRVGRLAVRVAPAAGLLLLWGCASEPRPLRGIEAAEESVGRPGRPVVADRARPPAAIDGRAVTQDELFRLLSERAGAELLEEIALDRRLRELADRRGVRLTPDAVAMERDRLRDAVRTGAEVDDAEAERLVERLRVSRGLGPTRFAALLERNALLRALVADEVVVEDESVRRAFEVRYGDRVRARLFVTGSEAEAARVRRSVVEADRPLGVFAEAAADRSTDRTASVGGRLGVVSPADVTLPRAIRQALQRTEPGAVSPVLALEGAFALIFIEARLGAEDIAFESVEAGLRNELRLAGERAAMDRLAASLAGRAGVEPIDQGLGWSWSRTRRGIEAR